MVFQDGQTLDDSYWLQTCRLSYFATGDQIDSAILPVSIIKGLNLENITKTLSEYEHYKTENLYLYILLVPLAIAVVVLGSYIYYIEYWLPAHEE